MKEPKEIIAAKNVSFSYKDKVIFENLNFNILENQKIALIGDSGTGKTSLIDLLLGFNKANSGKISVYKNEINSANIKKIRKFYSYLPQNLHIEFTVNDAIKLPFIFNKIKEPGSETIKELFERFSLNINLLEKQTSEISVGQLQRVILISIFLLPKPILFLDEPTSALDRKNAIKIFDYLSTIRKTVICSTHDKYWLEKSDLIIEL